MKRFSILILTIFSLILASCVQYEPVEVLSVNSAELVSISPTEARVKINVAINNPNEYDIKLQTKDLKLFLNGQLMGIANFDKKLTLEKSSKRSYEIEMVSTIPPDGNIDLGIIGLGGLMGQLQVKVDGMIKASAKGVSKEIPILIEENLAQ